MGFRLGFVILIVPMFFLLGCHDPAVWKLDVLSPDKAWTASVETDQWGGFGTAYIATRVSLKRLDGTRNHGRSFNVLEYPQNGPVPKAYVLSPENAGGGVDLKVRWLDASHLEISYMGELEPDLQVAKFGGVEISLVHR